MPQDQTPGNIQLRTKSYEDTITTTNSPIIYDIKGDISTWAVDGYIKNDGGGDILIEFSDNGTNYGGQHTIKKDEVLNLEFLKIHKIRITRFVEDASFRILVI